MFGRETRMLLRHYLGHGTTKSALARQLGVSRDTIHRWIRDGDLDRDLDATPVRYGPRPPVATKLDRYKPIIEARLAAYQVRTIAAEGRKYGIFLILCTQRPDKIDPLITSECQNRLLMKLGSQMVLNRAGELLGLDPNDHSDCLAFRLGNGTLIGKWGTDKGVRFLGGIRRTQEGGGEISKNWQSPPA